MRFGSVLFYMLLAVSAATPCFAQQQAKPRGSHRYRTIGAVAGGSGGFVLGVFAGMAMFDDAINSDRKVWTTALLTAAGGAVGGYFIGRALDKRGSTRRTPPAFNPWQPDPLDISLIQARSVPSVTLVGVPAGCATGLIDGGSHESCAASWVQRSSRGQ